MLRAQPLNDALHLLHAIGRGARSRFGDVRADELLHRACLVLNHLAALDHVRILQAHAATGDEAIVPLRRIQLEVFFIDVDGLAKRHGPLSELWAFGMPRYLKALHLPFWPVGNRQLDRLLDREGARCGFVQVQANAVLENGHVDRAVDL
eukprot:scaffold4067_cov267-Pinguiococcus_pyrenoidosus.AAC.3